MLKEIYPLEKLVGQNRLSFGKGLPEFSSRSKRQELVEKDKNMWFLWGIDPTISDNATHPPSQHPGVSEEGDVEAWNFGIALGIRLRAWIEKKDPWAYDRLLVTKHGESMTEWANNEVPIYLHKYVPIEEHKKLEECGTKNCPENVARRVLKGEAISCKELLTYNNSWNKEHQIRSKNFAYYYNEELKKHLKNEKSDEKKNSEEIKYSVPNFVKDPLENTPKLTITINKKESAMNENEDSKTKKVLIRTLSRRANANVKKLVVNTYVKKFPKGQQSTATKYIGDFLESEFGDAIVGVLIKNLVKGGQKLAKKNIEFLTAVADECETEGLVNLTEKFAINIEEVFGKVLDAVIKPEERELLLDEASPVVDFSDVGVKDKVNA